MNQQPPQTAEKIFAPNVYLCAYSLHDENTQGNNYFFWQDCDRILSHFTTERLAPHLDFSQTGKSDRSILLPDNKFSIPFTLTDSPEIEGFAQPLQIQDSYALFFNVGYDDENESTPEVAVNALEKFNVQNTLLLPKPDKFIGQTLLLTAYLTPELKQRYRQSLESLAHTCYSHLIGNNAPPLYRSGELLGSPIFEYGNPRQPDNSPHVLIWLFRDKQTDESLQKCFKSIFDLLFYRHKLIKLFQDSRTTYSQLTQYYRQFDPFLDNLQKTLDTANPNLDNLKSQLKQLAGDSLQYTRLLRKLEAFGNTIEINFYNYKGEIEQICATLGIDKEELSFFQRFGQEIAPLFRAQIQADLGYFEQGTELADRAIASIRGIVEIDQAQIDRETLEHEKESDRKIENLIYIVSAGLGGAGVVASSASYLTAGSKNGEMTIQWIPNPHQPIHPFTKVLGISIAIGFLLGLAVWGIRKWIESLDKDNGKSS